MKVRPNEQLQSWIDERNEDSLYVSVLTLGELRKGIEMVQVDRRKRARFEQALTDVGARFAGRVLPVDLLVAETWGEMNGRARNDAAPLSAIDSLIASTAIVHRLTVVTGNVRHFQRTGAQLFNPFEI
jgi:predicted nucleic acid-binding protein